MLFRRHSDFYNKYKKLAQRSSLRTFTPIHSGTNQYLPRSFNELFKFDLSEIDELDDLHNPEGFILEAQRKAAKLFQVEQTFFSVNGASSCLMAACLALGDGGKVLVPMNAHKSLLAGLILSGAEPVWYEPEWDARWGIYTRVEPEKIAELIRRVDNIKACFVTSPTYEGFQTKLGAIVDICHEHEIPVIVDESHGSHISLMGNGKGAIDACADLIIHSPHKALGALTQTGMLHFQSELLNAKKIEACMSLLQTTSPSFILLLSLIETLEHLRQDLEPLRKQKDSALELRYQLSKIGGIEFLNNDDPTRLVFSLAGWGGEELSQWILENYFIETELEGNRWVMFLIGLGTKHHQIRSLKRAIQSARLI
ncbi:MAG: aminotransferase class I/II-fold pyridoxal phosphate-dependent enzyme, partial [Candidatus Caenarcaniphilales bacterium]|nr:aminotransferase class I/II-fold pyridoxal phosphate-dependent enzyme [Candidatus Caenarcaniphilales bacterium]